MARTVVNYTVQDDGRDKGKTYVLTEMPASQAESWAMRAVLALMGGNVDVPAGFEQMGMAAMAEIGLRALGGLKWEVAQPLMDEMWSCVRMMPDPSRPHIIRPLVEEDIEEVATRIKLRAEIWKLHTGFLKAAAPSISAQPATATKNDSQNTATSRRR